MDSQSYIRNVLVRALGEEKASGLVDRILLGGSAQGLEMLKWMEPRAVADMLRDEHPQIVAIVLAYLDEEQSGVILSLLPEPLRVEVLMRVATLDSVQPAALQELNEILEVQMSSSGKGQSANVGGVKTAATILNYMDGGVESELIEKVKEKDLDLGQQIQDFMFVFEDLTGVDDASIQALLREISSESLLLALKGSDEKLKEKFFKNVSRRAAEMLRDDLEAQGPVRVSEVDKAQREILSIARRMADDGQIALGGRGAEEFL
jgi:flagellar motor switch protein FliG